MGKDYPFFSIVLFSEAVPKGAASFLMAFAPDLLIILGLLEKE